MKNTLDKDAFVEFLRFYLRPVDFERLSIASRSNDKSRFLFRMTQKVNNFEYLIITSQNQQTFIHFIPEHIAKKSFSELKDIDLIPDILFFAE